MIQEIGTRFSLLLRDPYGNYFCQKLLHHATSDQRISLLHLLSSDFVEVACDDTGTHPMQRLVEMINRDEERDIVFNSVKGQTEKMAFHPKGNYVLILILNILSKPMFEFIVDSLLDKIPQLAVD